MRAAFRALIVVFAMYVMAIGAPSWVRAQDSASAEAMEQAQGKTTEPTPESTPAQRQEQAPEQRSEQASEPTSEQAAKVDLSGYEPGTIVVSTSDRKLHLVLGNGEAITYPVGVGKAGKSWAGKGAIAGKFLRPPWAPPKKLKLEKPWTPDYIPSGSPSNPMGAAAMTLNVDQYAIHGTNDPSSIGRNVSFGCIRMHNRDILDLYKRVKVGTRVVVLQ